MHPSSNESSKPSILNRNMEFYFVSHYPQTKAPLTFLPTERNKQQQPPRTVPLKEKHLSGFPPLPPVARTKETERSFSVEHDGGGDASNFMRKKIPIPKFFHPPSKPGGWNDKSQPRFNSMMVSSSKSTDIKHPLATQGKSIGRINNDSSHAKQSFSAPLLQDRGQKNLGQMSQEGSGDASQNGMEGSMKKLDELIARRRINQPGRKPAIKSESESHIQTGTPSSVQYHNNFHKQAIVSRNNKKQQTFANATSEKAISDTAVQKLLLQKSQTMQKLRLKQQPLARVPLNKADTNHIVKEKVSCTKAGGDQGVSESNVSQTSGRKSAAIKEEAIEVVDPDVDEQFIRGRRLGKGAYGVVWQAELKTTGQEVALKKIYDAFRNETDAQRTYRELIILKHFGHHPHIISLIGAHKASNHRDLYLVFPLMKFDLYKIITKYPAVLTFENSRFIAYQLALALNYLHSADVIHRDLKPANILMDETLTVKLADFGLARSIPITNTQSRDANFNPIIDTMGPIFTDYVATRWYRPPEIIISSRIYDKTIDTWAFGCILGEILLKRALFAGDSANHQLKLILRTIDPPTNPEIEDLCRYADKKSKSIDVIRNLTLASTRGPSLMDIFYSFDCVTIDIIEKLLRFSPSRRLSIGELLEHPFFKCERDETREYRAARRFAPPIKDTFRLKVEDYRGTIYDIIDSWMNKEMTENNELLL